MSNVTTNITQINRDAKMEFVLREWFGSKKAAEKAALRAAKWGYKTVVTYAMGIEGRSDWCLQVYAEK